MAELSLLPLFSDAVSYWRLEGNSNDSKGSNNGSDTSVTYGVNYGRYGQGALMNGSSSYINVSHAASLNLSSNVSIACWIKYAGSDIGGEGSMGWFFKGNNTPSNRANYSMIWNGTGAGTGTGKINFFNGSNNNSDTFTWSNPTSYHLFVVTAASGGNIKYYFDGVQQGATKTMSGSLTTNTDNLTIGKVGPFGQFFNGSMDDIILFSKILTDAEILTLYNDLVSGGYYFLSY